MIKTKQERNEERRQEMMELNMAITGLQSLAERYYTDFALTGEGFSLISNLLAVTEELEDRKKSLISMDSSLVYHRAKINERSG